MTACLTDDDIAALLHGRLSTVGTAKAEQHMDACAACRRLVSQVAKSSFVNVPSSIEEDDDPTDPESTPPDLWPGSIVAARFRLLRLLGRGGMGRVYLADDLVLETQVAIKILAPEFAQTRLFKHLHHEVRLARRVSHANVCRLFDIGTSGSLHFITMEALLGETLEARLARGPVSEGQASAILAQICGALEAAHASSVVHRDLKPSNIMLAPDGKATVMDFGLAQDLAVEGSPERVGTPAYWAPEQKRGEAATVASDIYAVGLLAYELLVGLRAPRSKPPNLQKLPRRWRALVGRCVAEAPKERFASVARLRGALASMPITHRRRWMWGAALCVLLAVPAAIAALAHWPVAELDTRNPRPPPSHLPAAPPAAIATTPAPAKVPASSALRRPVNRHASEGHVKHPAPPKSEEPPAPSPAPAQDEVVTRVAALQRAQAQLGILEADAPAYREALSDARQHLQQGDTQGALTAVDLAEAQLRRVQIDETFVGKKLQRLSLAAKDKVLPPAAAEDLRARFAQVHTAYFKGDYEKANEHLNGIWRLLQAHVQP